jgi:hypothetical protein
MYLCQDNIKYLLSKPSDLLILPAKYFGIFAYRGEFLSSDLIFYDLQLFQLCLKVVSRYNING